jgi:hypothetical protein
VAFHWTQRHMLYAARMPGARGIGVHMIWGTCMCTLLLSPPAPASPPPLAPSTTLPHSLESQPCSQADAAKATFWETHCDPATANGRNGGAHLAYFEELLKAGSSGWMVGAALTAADLCVFDMVDLLLRIFPDQLPSAVSLQGPCCCPALWGLHAGRNMVREPTSAATPTQQYCMRTTTRALLVAIGRTCHVPNSPNQPLLWADGTMHCRPANVLHAS